jgi:O-antigen ligase/tetratricopeptide (TPR) repeat protein
MAKNSKLSVVLSCLVVLGLAAILIITPVKRGMFFRQDYLPFFSKAAWFFVGVAVILIIERHSIWQHMPDLALLAVVALYGLTVFWAKSKGAAIDGALKYCVYLGIFLSAKYASRNRTGNRLLRWSIVASGVVAAMVGLLAAAGLISYKDAVVGGRIFGSFQYPNALAAYEMFVSFILLHAWLEIEDLEQSWSRWLGKMLFSLSGFIILLVIVLSYSRATWIIFAASIVGYFAMLPAKTRGGIFLRFMTAIVPVLIVNVPLAQAIPAAEYSLVKKYILVGAAICLAAEAARTVLTSLALSKTRPAGASKEPRAGRKAGTSSTSGGASDSNSRKNRALARIPVALAIVIAAALIFGFTTEAGQKVLAKVVPEAVIRRFKSITLTDRSLVTRFFATKDAFLIAKDHPLGTGAGGWNALYHRYQTVLYWFTETHNHFAQVMVETGFPGLAAYAAFWVFVFYTAFKAWRLAMAALKAVAQAQSPGDNATNAGTSGANSLLIAEMVATAFSVLALVVHSSADFDLSIPAIAMALFAATGSLLASSEAVLAIDGIENLYAAAGKSAPAPESDSTGKKRGAQGSSSKPGRGKRTGKASKKLPTPSWQIQSRYLLDAVSLVILAIVIMVPANRYFKGMVYGSAAIQEIVKENMDQARDLMHEAMKYDPNTPSYALDLAGSYVHEYTETKDPDAANMAKQYLALASEKNPYDLDHRSIESQMLAAMGLYDESAEVAYEVTEMIPLDIRFYERLASSAKDAMLTHGVSVLSQGLEAEEKQQHIEAMKKYAGLIKGIPARLQEQKSGITGLYEKIWNPNQLNITQPIALALGQEYFLEGNREAAVEHLTMAGKKADLKEEAGLWLRAIAIATKTNVALPEGIETNEEAATLIAGMYGLLSH